MSRFAALLLLLGAALATVPGKPTLLEIQGGWKTAGSAGAKVSIASTSQIGQQDSSYEVFGVETKDVCMMETSRRNCDEGPDHDFFT